MNTAPCKEARWQPSTSYTRPTPDAHAGATPFNYCQVAFMRRSIARVNEDARNAEQAREVEAQETAAEPATTTHITDAEIEATAAELLAQGTSTAAVAAARAEAVRAATVRAAAAMVAGETVVEVMSAAATVTSIFNHYGTVFDVAPPVEDELNAEEPPEEIAPPAFEAELELRFVPPVEDELNAEEPPEELGSQTDDEEEAPITTTTTTTTARWREEAEALDRATTDHARGWPTTVATTTTTSRPFAARWRAEAEALDPALVQRCVATTTNEGEAELAFENARARREQQQAPLREAYEASAVAQRALWKRTACTHCGESAWRDHGTGLHTSTDGDLNEEFWCKACVKDPNRVMQCGICFESCMPVKLDHNKLLLSPGFQRMASERDRANLPCQVAFCAKCAATHVKTQLNDGAHTVQCPGGCGTQLKDEEIRKMCTDTTLYAKLQENRAEHLVDAFDRAPELLEWAGQGNAQVCPHCYTLVQRNGGCRHIRCRCGGEFCYHCGEKYGGCHCTYNADGAKPVMRMEVMRHMVEKRRKRRMAFLMGGRDENSLVYKLSPDVMRRIVESVK